MLQREFAPKQGPASFLIPQSLSKEATRVHADGYRKNSAVGNYYAGFDVFVLERAGKG